MADRIHVFTFKEGLLSRVAHDLRLSVELVSVEWSGERVAATIDPRTFVVDGVMADGRLDREALGRRDRDKILANIRDEVLETRRFPTIEFDGSARERDDGKLEISGELTLHGVSRPLSFTAARHEQRIRASLTLRPSDFAVQPYKALAGAIRLQDRVVIELEIAQLGPRGD